MEGVLAVVCKFWAYISNLNCGHNFVVECTSFDRIINWTTSSSICCHYALCFFLQIINFQNWLRVSEATIISNGKPNNMSSVSLLMTLCIAGSSEVSPSLWTMNIRKPFYKFNIHSREILSAFYIRIERHSVIETRVH
jgi:hypothetical protein